MAVTSGFFNALNKDRMYNSEQMSTIFDGIIRDGIFASIGSCLVVEASTGLNVAVGIGKAWFNHTWTLNDAILPLTADLSDVLFDRVDAVILEVNNTESVRDNTIKFIKGTASSTPILPDLIETEHVHQHALAYVYRPANSTVITAVNITNMVGSVQTPFITGVLDVISVDEILGQWRAELDLFVDTEEADFTTWYNGMKTTMEDVAAELNIWTAAQQAEILAWFDDMKNQLSTDAAANLQLQINELEDVVGDSIFIGTQGDITPTIPSNADMLGNQLPGYYAKQTSVDIINTDLNGLKFVEITSGKWGYKIGGADPVIPFNTFEGKWYDISMISNGGVMTVNCGFKPKMIHIYISGAYRVRYSELVSKTTYDVSYDYGATWKTTFTLGVGSPDSDWVLTLTDTGYTFKEKSPNRAYTFYGIA